MPFFLELSNDILNPTVFIGDFEIREPVTTLTDFITACVSGVCFVLFSINRDDNKNNAYVFFKFYFLFYFIGMTSAAFLGHALQAYVPKEVKVIGWVFSTLAQLCLALGTMKLVKDIVFKKWYNLIHFMLIFQSVIFIFLMIHPKFSDFKIAQLAASLVLIGIVFPLHTYNYFKTKSYGSRSVILIILYALVPAFIYNNQISVNRWFNYHDISHLLMSVFMMLMYLATKKLSFNKPIS
jgi:hypothetical protein